jgi:hypothetical protein
LDATSAIQTRLRVVSDRMKFPGYQQLKKLLAAPFELRDRIDSIQQALGRIEARQTASVAPGDLALAEFRVSSQWGEDGIIAHLLRHVPIANQVFVEFGVQDYQESNTRFLLRNCNWSGLVLDGSPQNIAIIRNDPIYWRHNLKAEAAFITRENINDLISQHGISGDIGLLSIDIDGNDYWVWEAISVISPRIVIVEYNALFGPKATVSVPYDIQFRRSNAHFSNLYWGCSLGALEYIAAHLGYMLVNCNSNGNNAFFVRTDLAHAFPKAINVFRPAKFRESRSRDGALTFLSETAAISQIRDLPMVDVRTLETKTVGEFVEASASRVE